MSIFRQRLFLLRKLVLVELKLKHQKSILGNVWYILTPMIYAALYYFAFSHVFSARSDRENTLANVVILFLGVSLHGYLAEILNKSTFLIQSNINYVKKVIFPLEILCFRDSIIGLVPLFFALLIGAVILIFNHVSIGFIGLAMITIIPYIMIVLAINLVFSALSVFINDLKSLSIMLTTVLLFLSPVLYNIDNFPHYLQVFFYLNPLTYPIQTFRDLVSGALNWYPFIKGYAAYFATASIFLIFSYVFFNKMKKHFVDVL